MILKELVTCWLNNNNIFAPQSILECQYLKNPFGHNLYIKKWLIRIFGWLTHRRFKGLIS